MADLITKGMPDWQKPINDFAANNAIVVSPWTTTGITYTNGFGLDSNPTSILHYRTLDQGPQRTIQFAGWIKIPALSGGQKVAFASIPVSLFKGCTGFVHQNGRYSQVWGNLQDFIDISTATGELFVQNYTARDAGGGLKIDYSITW